MGRSGTLLQVGQSWTDEPFVTATAEALDHELRVTAVHDPPYISIYPHANGSYSYDGYIYELWQLIARRLGLRYRVVPLLGGAFGGLDSNGTWNGMVGELAYGRADVALTWLTLRHERAAVIDYIDTMPIDGVKLEFFIRRGTGEVPRLSPVMLGSLLKPFDTNVWWALLASMFVLSVVLRLTLWLSHPRGEERRTVEEMTWGSCLLSCFMSVIGRQSWATTPSSTAARIVTVFSWILGIIIHASYTATLISHLTVTVTVDRPISSLKEFSEQSDWMFAIEPGHAHLDDWKLSEDVYKRKLYWRAFNRQGFIALDWTPESIRRILKPRVMSFTTLNRLSQVFGEEACSLVTLNDHQPPMVTNGYMVMAKGQDDLRRSIAHLMLRMYETGQLQRLRNKWVSSNASTCELSTHSRALSFGDFLPVSVIVPLALILSSAILFIEVIY